MTGPYFRAALIKKPSLTNLLHLTQGLGVRPRAYSLKKSSTTCFLKTLVKSRVNKRMPILAAARRASSKAPLEQHLFSGPPRPFKAPEGLSSCQKYKNTPDIMPLVV